MATTTKTLAPTNQTITLPDMTERPNASVLVDGIGKAADAINALSTQLNGLNVIRKTIPGNSSVTVTCSSSCHAFMIGFGVSNARNAWIVRQSGSGSPAILALSESTNLTTSISDANITFTLSGASNAMLYILLLNGAVS